MYQVQPYVGVYRYVYGVPSVSLVAAPAGTQIQPYSDV
jgi:hypothetical protein